MRRFSTALWPITMSVMLAFSLCASAPLSVVADDDEDEPPGKVQAPPDVDPDVVEDVLPTVETAALQSSDDKNRRGDDDDDDDDDRPDPAEDAVGDLIVTLRDDGRRVVRGACFQLVDAGGNVIAESCDTRASGDRNPNNGRTGFFDVPAGEYMLRLVALPSGIQPVDVRAVKVRGNRESNEAVTIIMQDEETPVPTEPVTPQPTEPMATEPAPTAEPAVGDLIVTLLDDEGTPIGRACFELIDANGDDRESCDTEAYDAFPDNGNTGFLGVPAGTYTLRLKAAPEGVESVDDREVTVAAGSEVTETITASVEEEPEEAPGPTAPTAGNGGDDDDFDDRRADQAIIRLMDGVDPATFAGDYGFTLLRSIPERNIHLLGLDPTVADADEVTDLDKDDGTVWAEFNYTNQAPEGRPRRFFTSGGHSAPMAADEPPPAALNLDAASCVTGAGVIVAVLDTGIDAGHPALAGQVLGGYNVVANSANTADAGDGIDNDLDGYVDEMTGHGTHVAGIIHKVAPGASLLPVTVLDSDGVGDAFYVAQGIYFAVDNGSQVLNLSLSSTTDARVVNEATAWAAGQGVMVVAAAGNENLKQPVEYPATYDGAYSVAASDPSDAKADFSNYNAAVDLSAPGIDIVSAFPGGSYVAWSGTSMATPFVAGASALLWERLGGGSSQIRDALAAGADPLVYTESNWNEHLGAGRLNVGQSVNCGG